MWTRPRLERNLKHHPEALKRVRAVCIGSCKVAQDEAKSWLAHMQDDPPFQAR